MVRAVLVLSLCCLAGCTSNTPPARRLVISSSRAFQSVAKAFSEGVPEIRADFEATSSARAVVDVREGLADLAFLGRDLRPDETSLVPHALARDAIALVVHRDNPIASLTTSQVVNLFTRNFTDWRELGGSDRSIIVVGMAEGRAVREVFLDYLGLQSVQVRADPVVANSEQVVQAVASRPGAVGYVSLAHARDALRTAPVRLVPLAGVKPGSDTIETGKYPFVRPIILVTRPNPSPAVLAYLAFARTEEGKAILTARGYMLGAP